MQKLSNQQWWRKLCPQQTIEFLRLPAQTTRAEAWANMLSKIAELERELAEKSSQAPKTDVIFHVMYDEEPSEAIQNSVEKNVAPDETLVTQMTRTPNAIDPFANRMPVIDIPIPRPQLPPRPKSVIPQSEEGAEPVPNAIGIPTDHRNPISRDDWKLPPDRGGKKFGE